MEVVVTKVDGSRRRGQTGTGYIFERFWRRCEPAFSLEAEDGLQDWTSQPNTYRLGALPDLPRLRLNRLLFLEMMPAVAHFSSSALREELIAPRGST